MIRIWECGSARRGPTSRLLLNLLLSFFIGVIVSSLIVMTVLYLTGDSTPMETIDASFDSRPLGNIAVIIYVACFFFRAFGTWAGYKTSKKLLSFLIKVWKRNQVEDQRHESADQ